MARRISAPSGKSRPAKSRNDYLPTRDDILKFINDNPDLAGKRDIAKAFNLKGDARIFLKEILRELADEGLVEKRKKRLATPGRLPSMAVLDIFGRDSDGGLLAKPAEWDEHHGETAPTVLIRSSRDQKGPTAGIGDRVLARIFPSKEEEGPAYTARVVKRIEKRRNTVLGVLRRTDSGEWRLEPVERRQAELVVAPDQLGDAKQNDLVEVEVSKIGRYGLSQASVKQVVGSLESEKALSMIAIHEHEIPHDFPESVLEEAADAKPATIAHREDWRDVPLITIDPADAKDHDDAVYAEPDTSESNVGGHIAIVAIADVASYVMPGSTLDREALKRGNSVYFPDRVVPMLPERISNDLCSLKELVDRPALAVRMVFAPDGRKISHSFHRIMMRSKARLAYTQAQAAIDGAPDEKTTPILHTILKPLWAAYAALKRGRDSREPLELDLPERKILLTPDGKVDKVIIPPRLDAHKLIEEFMIQANVAAAETLERKRQRLIFRIHDGPSMAKQESLREFLRSVNISLSRGAQLRPSQFNNILKQVEGSDYQELVNQVVLRSQSQAEYSPENIGHFGLNLQRYAHFTSPIRRYADLMVHRALIGSLGLGAGGLTPDEEARLEEISALISSTERRAMTAERDTVDRLIAHHLASQIDAIFEGRISGVTNSGLFVALTTYGADGFIPISTLGNEYYIFDEANRTISGERTGKGWRLGDIVEVRLVEALPVAGALRFEMLTDAHSVPTSNRSFHKSKRPGARKGSRPGGIPTGKQRGRR
ncbi:MAG: ribonuclease R [Phyllobacterium sp.]